MLPARTLPVDKLKQTEVEQYASITSWGCFPFPMAIDRGRSPHSTCGRRWPPARDFDHRRKPLCYRRRAVFRRTVSRALGADPFPHLETVNGDLGIDLEPKPHLIAA